MCCPLGPTAPWWPTCLLIATAPACQSKNNNNAKSTGERLIAWAVITPEQTSPKTKQWLRRHRDKFVFKWFTRQHAKLTSHEFTLKLQVTSNHTKYLTASQYNLLDRLSIPVDLCVSDADAMGKLDWQIIRICSTPAAGNIWIGVNDNSNTQTLTWWTVPHWVQLSWNAGAAWTALCSAVRALMLCGYMLFMHCRHLVRGRNSCITPETGQESSDHACRECQ